MRSSLPFLLSILLPVVTTHTTPIRDAAQASPRQRAEALLAKMTWKEKIGQMGGIRRLLDSGLEFNRTLYDELHETQNGILGFGSMFNPATEVLPLANRIRREQIEGTRLGIPWITVTDSVNSVYLEGGTLFPATLSMGSSWNVPLYEKAIAAIREEAVALRVHWVLSPELDLALEPRGGRVGEMYGEDKYHVGEFGAAYVRTMQEKDDRGFVKVATTIKHFVYGLNSGGVNTASMFGGINHILNDLAHPYIRAIKENAMSLMASYASVDQVPMAANKFMLQTVLRKRMGFRGLIMSDALAILNLNTISLTASTPEAAGLKALRAGLALELSPVQPAVYPTLIDAIQDQQVQDLINDSVSSILEIKFATGQFDLPLPTLKNLKKTLRAHPHLEVNRDMSRESIVLLQNDGILPISKNRPQLAVLGPFADLINAGSYAPNNSSQPQFGRSLRRSLEKELGTSNVQYVQGCDIIDPTNESISEAVSTAKASDLAILMLGSLSTTLEDPLFVKRTDGEFFAHADLGFPGAQQRLLDAVLETGVPTVLILSGGQSFALSNSTLGSNAILHSFLGGEYTADSLTEILFGKTNPSGKLSITMPQASGAIPVNYDYLPSDDAGGPGSFSEVIPSSDWQLPVLTRDPPMKFGFGLSYTSFEIANPTATVGDGNVQVTTTVENTGSRAGREVVQLYFHKSYTTIERPVKSLIRFEKVGLQPGESKEINFSIPIDELGYFINMEWTVERGNYTFFVGSSSKDVDLKAVNIII